MNEEIQILKSEQDSILFANQMAKKLKGGQVVGLVGDLGVGKTFFVKALGKAFGIKQVIKSPSFNLMKVYPIRKTRKHENTKIPKTLVHIDCYRLNSPEALVDIGFLEYCEDKNSLVIVEWADKVKKILPKDAVWLKFRTRKDDSRVVKIS